MMSHPVPDYPLEGVCKRLEAIYRRAHEVRERFGPDPLDGSPYADENAGADEYERPNLLHAVHLANLRLTVAEDHFMALAAAVRHPHVIYAPYATARTIAELSARAWWLLKPRIGPTVRSLRYTTERLYSFQEAIRLGFDEVSGHQQSRLDMAVEAARAQDIHLPREGRFKYFTTSERRPSGGKLLAEVLRDDDERRLGTVMYQLLSAFTHGTSVPSLKLF